MDEQPAKNENHSPAQGRTLTEGTLHVGFVSSVVAFALSKGLTSDQIHAETNLDVAALGDPDARLPDDVVGHLWNALSGRHPHRPITLEAARGVPYLSLGGLAHGMQYAATLRNGISFFERNSRILADRLSFQLVDENSEDKVVIGHPNDVLDDGRTAEMGLGIFVRFVREILNLSGILKQIDLKNRPCGPVAEYEGFFDCSVRFGAAENAVFFCDGMLDRPVKMADTTIFKCIEHHFEIQRRQIRDVSNNSSLVALKRAVAECASMGEFRIEAILLRAHMERRGAQRLAELNGTTLTNLIDTVRRANAEALLADVTIPINVAASSTGYSDDRAFRRAFHRWTGMSPSAYRKLLWQKNWNHR